MRLRCHSLSDDNTVQHACPNSTSLRKTIACRLIHAVSNFRQVIKIQDLLERSPASPLYWISLPRESKACIIMFVTPESWKPSFSPVHTNTTNLRLQKSPTWKPSSSLWSDREWWGGRKRWRVHHFPGFCFPPRIIYKGKYNLFPCKIASSKHAGSWNNTRVE